MDKKFTELKGIWIRKLVSWRGGWVEDLVLWGRDWRGLSGRVERLGSAFTGYREFLLSFWLVRGY
jgi:hypothetical protein